MNVRRFHGGAVDSVVLDGNDCSFSTINSERHVESIAVPVVENAEKPIRGTTAVMRRPRFQSMHEHALRDIVIVKDEPSCLPPVAVRPPHAHDSGYDGDDRRRPSRPITNSNGRKHENDSKENPMNNEIQKFDFKGAALRTLTDEAGEPWFVAKDVCDILGTDTRDLHKILESDEITNVDSIHIAQNGGKAPLIISEPGLYRLVMKSRKPEAKEFQRWVTHEVLPQIRRTGGYIPTTDCSVFFRLTGISASPVRIATCRHSVRWTSACSASRRPPSPMRMGTPRSAALRRSRARGSAISSTGTGVAPSRRWKRGRDGCL